MSRTAHTARTARTACCLLAALALLADPAAGYFPPAPEEAVLANYDVRQGGGSPIAGSLASSPAAGGEERPSLTRPVPPTTGQEAALSRLTRELGRDLTARMGGVAGLPRTLFSSGGALSPPRPGDDAVAIARDFLASHTDLFALTRTEIDRMRISKDHITPGTGTRNLLLVQQVRGVDVYHGEVRVAVAADGRVLWVSVGDVQPGLDLDVQAPVSAERAARLAGEYCDLELATSPSRLTSQAYREQVFASPATRRVIRARPVVFPMHGAGTIAWLVDVWPRGKATAYSVVVDGRNGELLRRVLLTSFATNAGLVFDGPYPDTFPSGTAGPVSQSQVSFGYRWPSTAGWTTPAPYGDYQLTTGNNVDATVNVGRNDDVPPIPGVNPHADGGPLQEWLFPFLNAYETSGGDIPSALLDQDASITNLFFLINMWHDYTHALGFTEAAGNFQYDNFSRGGCGTDQVYAWSMWGAAPASGPPSLNNASFNPPPEDATSCPPAFPRNGEMRMFLFSLPTVARDSSFDASIVIHEMTHGVSMRMVGGPFDSCLWGIQSGGMGEGWSDWFPASYYDSPLTGEYVVDRPGLGGRTFRMDANPRTYADLCSLPPGCEVHNEGEIHASLLWDVRALLGRTVSEQLVMDSFTLMPCSPSFLDGRDALLLADQIRHGGAHACDIWSAYVARGMGLDADGADSSYAVADFTFTHPSCSGSAHLRYDGFTTSDVAGGDGDGRYGMGEVIDLEVDLANVGVATGGGVTVTVSTATPGVVMVEDTRTYPDVPAGASVGPVAPFSFRIDPGFLCGSGIEFAAAISWDPALTRSDSFVDRGGSSEGTRILFEDFESTPAWSMTGFAGPSGTDNHTPSGSSSAHLLAGCYAGDSFDCVTPGPCDGQCSTVVSEPFGLPAEQAAQLGFWVSYNLELGADGVWAEVSTDGGLTWTGLTTIPYPANVLDGPCSPAPPGAISGPPGNAERLPWTYFEGSLAAYAGRIIQVRIVYQGDYCIYFEGAYLDDIQVTVAECTSDPFVNLFVHHQQIDDTALASCTDGDANPDPGESVDWSITLQNAGSATATGVQATIASASPAISIAAPTLAYADIPPGETATVTYRYDVDGGGGVACFEGMTMDVDISADGGVASSVSYDHELRTDPGVGLFFDGFDGFTTPWVPSLGPDGSVADWSLEHLDCISFLGDFWATQVAIDPLICDTLEPDYSDDSDSLLTSPPIDLGRPGSQLVELSWLELIPGGVPAAGGFLEVLIDHDNDGVFTPIVHTAGGETVPALIDIQANPLGAPILPDDTARFVTIQLRFRATAADPGLTLDSEGWMIDMLQLLWRSCDWNPCAPGFSDVSSRERSLPR